MRHEPAATKQTMRDENDERWDMNLENATKQMMRDEPWTMKISNDENERYNATNDERYSEDATKQTMRDDPWTMKIDERYSTINVSRDEL